MSKCTGCGVELQNINKEGLGYTINLNNNLCERCFRIRNYNDYKFVTKDNSDYISILKNINKTDDLVILVIDLFNISSCINQIFKYINNPILLVLTKRDILPLSCYDEKLKNYFTGLNIIDTLIVSSKKNYNLDELYNKILKYKNSNNAYVVGFTNSGKSTLINKIIYNFSDSDIVITTSNLPSTTIDSINVKVNDSLTLIDTPGLLDDGDIVNYVDSKTLKKIVPVKEIRPITYQIKSKQKIIIDDLVRLDIFNNVNLTIYMSNKLYIRRIYKDTDELSKLNKVKLSIDNNCDIVIQGLGFISVKCDGKCEFVIYVQENVNVFTRKSLV